MGLSNDLSCEAGSLSCCRPHPHGHLQSEVRLYFPAQEPGVTWSASVPPFIQVYQCASVGSRGATCCSACPTLRHSESGPLGLSVRECEAAGSASGQTACPFGPTLRQSRSCHVHASPLHPGAHLRLSYWSGCMFLFYLFGVGFPCRLIFCQFWLCEEAQCVYLRRHLGSSSTFLHSRDIWVCGESWEMMLERKVGGHPGKGF